MHNITSTVFRCAYNTLKVIKATFSQGHPKFGLTTGI